MREGTALSVSIRTSPRCWGIGVVGMGVGASEKIRRLKRLGLGGIGFSLVEVSGDDSPFNLNSENGGG